MNKKSIPKPPTPPPIRVVKDSGFDKFDFIAISILVGVCCFSFLLGALVGGGYGR